MVFSSPTFLFLFMPAVLVLTWAAPRKARRFVLLAASLIFYAWGVQTFLLLILATTLADYALALGMGRARAEGRERLVTGLCTVGIVQNLAILFWFKYASWGSSNLDWLAGHLGFGHVTLLHVLLPIGVSFFTFEKISYLVDVKRGVVEPRRDVFDVLLFVSLFPRAIAGPIVRLREVADSLHEPTPRAAEIQQGTIRFAYGLAKKVMIADQIAPIADQAFASSANGDLTTAAAWLGALAYTLQLYFDFSAYSDMAIGIGLMIGFRFPENFRRPYSAVSITDYWRRWHMTLTRWFRDYLFIPLGGSRGSTMQTYRNLLLVFVLTALWHGAAWNKLVWGVYQGCWLILERRFGWRVVDDGRHHLYVAFRRFATFAITLLGLVIFRNDGLSETWAMYKAMFVPTGGMTDAVALVVNSQSLFLLAVACSVAFLPGRESGGVWLTESTAGWRRPTRALVMIVGLPIVLGFALAGAFSPFIYFQF